MTNPDNVGGLLNPCVDCGNDFIELFGGGGVWWVGCKPCSKAGRYDHLRAKTRGEAIAIWNRCNRTELCRAAPAGSGEVENLASRLVSMSNGLHSAHLCTDLRRAAALLRKLQQGVE